jgi:acyl carrier protein
MDTASSVRQHLFESLIPTPRERWPDDAANLFDLGLDSIRIMRLLVFVEQEFGIVIPDETITPERLASVRSISELVDAQRALAR